MRAKSIRPRLPRSSRLHPRTLRPGPGAARAPKRSRASLNRSGNATRVSCGRARCHGRDCDRSSNTAQNCSRSVDQDESHLEIDPILGNLPILHDDLLSLDPRALDILECLGRASDALFDGILEALFELEIISVTLATDIDASFVKTKYCRAPTYDVWSSAIAGSPLPKLRRCRGRNCAKLLTSTLDHDTSPATESLRPHRDLIVVNFVQTPILGKC